MFTGIIFAGIIAAISMIFLLLKLDIRKVCGYDIYVDIGFTFLLAWMLAGTFTGMMAALLGGCLVSIFLYIMKRSVGYKKLTFNHFKLHWRHYNVEKQF